MSPARSLTNRDSSISTQIQTVAFEFLPIPAHDAMLDRVFNADLAGEFHDFAVDAAAMGHDQNGLVEIIQRHADDGLSRPQNGHGRLAHRLRADGVRFVGVFFIATERRAVFPIEKAHDRMIDAGGSVLSAERQLSTILAAAAQVGEVREVAVKQPSLENLFIKITGRELRG